jgi:hypothetical protein
MTAPPNAIIPVTMRKTDGAPPRDPAMRRVDSLRRVNRDRSTVTVHRSLLSLRTARNRIARAVLIHSSPSPTRGAHFAVTAPPITLSP